MISKRTISKVLKQFNKYRIPTVQANFIGKKRNTILFRFSGPFCYTCGFYDYFDDLRLELERAGGHPVEIKEIKDRNDGDFTAVFTVRPLVGY